MDVREKLVIRILLCVAKLVEPAVWAEELKNLCNHINLYGKECDEEGWPGTSKCSTLEQSVGIMMMREAKSSEAKDPK